MGTQDELLAAIDARETERVRTLVERDPSLAAARDEEGVSLVLHALYRGGAELVEKLLAARPELDGFDAAALGDTDRLRALLEADPALAVARSPDGFTALHLAAFFGHRAGVELLLEGGADVDAVAENPLRVRPLHSALARGDAGIVGLLLEAGADPNTRQQAGFTPLHAAAQTGRDDLAELLLARGADPAAAAEDGRTAADYAASGGHAALAERLRD